MNNKEFENLLKGLRLLQDLSSDDKIKVMKYLNEPAAIIRTASMGDPEKIALTIYKSIRFLLDSGLGADEIVKKVSDSMECDPAFLVLAIQNVRATIEAVPTETGDIKILANVDPKELQKILVGISGYIIYGKYKSTDEMIESENMSTSIDKVQAIARFFMNKMDDILKGDSALERIEKELKSFSVPKESINVFLDALKQNQERFREVYTYRMLRDINETLSKVASDIKKSQEYLQEIAYLMKNLLTRPTL
jgi:hypothetical protein